MTTPAPAATASAQASHALIVDALGRRIAGGTLAEGERVTVAQLEEEFAASRTVVREAVRVLEAHGLVVSRRRVGVTVAPRAHWRNLDGAVIAWTLDGPVGTTCSSSSRPCGPPSSLPPRTRRPGAPATRIEPSSCASPPG